MGAARALWIAFLLLWSATQLAYGAVAPQAVAATALALALLNLTAMAILPGGLKLSKGTVGILVAIAGVFALQFLPVPFLFPATSAARAGHGIGGLWPGTADAFLTTRVFAQVSAYVLSALLILKLRGEGLSTSDVLKGIGAVLVLQAGYAVVQSYAGLKEIPFYGPRPQTSAASGTFVNRNTFAGVLAMGLVTTAGLAYSRLAGARRSGAAAGRRLEAGIGWALASALLAFGIVLSKSRGGAVAGVVGVLLLPFLHRGRASLAGAVVVLALGVAGVLLADPSILLDRFADLAAHEIREDSRWKIWTSTAAAAAHQPVLGFGIGTHPTAYHPYQPPSIVGQVHHAHNEVVNFFFEGGAVWTILLSGAFVLWAVRSWSSAQRLPGPDRFLPMAAIAAACGETVHSLVDFDLRATSAGMLFAVLIGLGGAVQRSAAEPSRRPWGSAMGLSTLAALALLLLPLDSDAIVTRAASSDPARVEEQCLRALGRSPFNFRAAWILARSAEERGDLALAVRRYEVAADLWPAHPGLQKDVGLRFWARFRATGSRADRDRAARMFGRLLEQHPSELDDLMQSIWQKDVPLDDVEAVVPPSPGARGAFAAFLVSKGRWKEGFEVFRRGCPEEPANAAIFDGFAQRLEAEGQWGMAATVRDKRVRFRSDPAAHASAARAWLRLGAYDCAVEQASLARRTDPSRAEWAVLAGDAMRAGGKLDAALEAYVEAVRLAPFDVGLLLKRASLYAQMRLHSSAAEDYRQVLRSRPSDREATLGLVRALADSGDRVGARRVLEEYLRLIPSDQEAASLRDSLLR